MSTTVAPDLLDPAFYADVDAMHDAFRALRASGPVWRDERNGQRITALEVVEPPDIEPNIFAGAVRSCRMRFTSR